MAWLIRLRGVLFVLLGLAVALIPAWFYLAIRAFAEPAGFWQEFALGVVGMWVLGSIQFTLLLLWAGLSFLCWGMVEDQVASSERRGR